MRSRTIKLGDRNLVGRTVTRLRRSEKMTQKELMAQLQCHGVNINYTSLSKLEGQTRMVSDKELVALAQVFRVEIKDLLI